jgi:hypothetical protein
MSHYSVISSEHGTGKILGMKLLRDIFPEAKADYMNFCLFSTSGVHGSYQTIEEAEEHIKAPTDETCNRVTFLIVHPRMVCLKYGNCEPETLEDIQFLKALRASSHEEIAQIGMP